MDVVRIIGGYPLKGKVSISGSKNACLPIFAATLLTDEPCIIHNVPDLADVRFMAEILQHLGATIERIGPNSWKITAKNIIPKAPYELVKKMRASVCLMGPLIGRLKQAEVSLPGGCVIGQRPIDLHIKGFAQMGCDVSIEQGNVKIDASRIRGTDLFLGGRFGSTVTGTENILMAAVLAKGTTHIDSAACEPEVADLCNMLVAMGAKITGIGTHELVIDGVDRLHGCEYTIIGDRIEAGTFIVAALMTQSNLTLSGIEPAFLRSFFHKLDEAEAFIAIGENKEIIVKGNKGFLSPVELTTLPFPGFPTDLQAQMCALMSITPGLSIITERIYPNRFMHVPELQRMGANIAIEGNSAIINGQSRLNGAPVMASDLRASAALYLAGLVANGETWVQRIYHVDRGYEKFDDKLRALGANILRVPESEMPKHLID